MSASDDGLPAGTIIDERYVVIQRIGAGGMDSVYRAEHLTLRHHVAIKLMNRELSRNRHAVERFTREARLSALLNHPHTIRVQDFGATEDGFLFLVMELLHGQPLKQALASRQPLGLARAVRIARSVPASLDEAHAKGLVHRDLKPDNIFLCRHHRLPDYVKVLDFGIAKALDATDGALQRTRTGMVIGTPKYLSPEQATASHVDPRADLYSLGVVLYEMLTGSVPFNGPTYEAVRVMHLSTPAPPLPTRIGSEAIPPALRQLVAALLAKAPAEHRGGRPCEGGSDDGIGGGRRTGHRRSRPTDRGRSAARRRGTRAPRRSARRARRATRRAGAAACHLARRP